MGTKREYVNRMKEGHSVIYYSTGRNSAAVSPSSSFWKIEAVYMVDPIDENAFEQLKESDKKRQKSTIKEGVDTDHADEHNKREYVNRMNEGQHTIYCSSGERIAAGSSSSSW